MYRKYNSVFLVFLLITFHTKSQAQSKAHEYSRFAIIDPAYNSNSLFPKPGISEAKTFWIYGPSELECRRLQLLIHRKDSAKLKVGYPGVFHKPYTQATFRLKLKKPRTLHSISYRIVGHGKLYINNELISDVSESRTLQMLNLKRTYNISQIQFDISTADEDIPALLVETKSISTDDKHWEWEAKGNNAEPATHYPQNQSGLPPHRLEDPVIIVKPVSVKDNLYDFGRELFGYIVIQSKDKPIISAGESIPEALDTTGKFKEQSAALINISKGLWRTKHLLAFRYVYPLNNEAKNIWTEAVFRPETYKGAFACSDSILTKIWMNSAYTLRLCMHDFLLDGVKRDRLPWAGDLAMSLLVNAYTFSDKELVRRSLVALGREGIKEKDINGIVDFSLWWIISQDQYQLYYADMDHLQKEWERIKEILNTLSSNTDADGFLVPRKDTWLFIDWVKQEKWTALQVLWWWAQNSAANLARRVGDYKAANYWINNAKKFKGVLSKASWSESEQRWLSKNDTMSEITRHPNFFAVVSGLADQNQYAGIRALLQGDKVNPVGTPYMAGFEVMGLSRLGDTEYMLRRVKEYWGGMLQKDATTFWEAYDPLENGTIQYSFYKRPYGKSLCHAWSSGPAAFLPSGLFGLKPTADGWKRFTLHPNLGTLRWASVSVPTKYGNITVDIKNKDIQIVIPKGTTLEWKEKTFIGPRLLQEKL